MASAASSDQVIESIKEEKKAPSLRLVYLSQLENHPIVKILAEAVTTVYAKIKNTNSVTKRTLSSAESIAKNVISTASPLFASFQKPIDEVDSFVSSSLDYVEEHIPTIKRDLEQESSLWSYISETRAMKILHNIPEYYKKIINTSLVYKAQLALSELRQYLPSSVHPRNLNVYEFITKKIELILSGLTKETTNEDDAKSRTETIEDESLKKTTEASLPQETTLPLAQDKPEPEESQPKTERTNGEENVEKAS